MDFLWFLIGWMISSKDSEDDREEEHNRAIDEEQDRAAWENSQ